SSIQQKKILSPPEIFKDTLYCCPVKLTRIGLISTCNAQGISHVRPSTYHCIHNGPHCRSIGYITHALKEGKIGIGPGIGRVRFRSDPESADPDRPIRVLFVDPESAILSGKK